MGFDRQIASALKLIKKNGQLVKWRTIPDAVIADPDKPWDTTPATPAVPVEHDVYIVFLLNNNKGLESLAHAINSEVAKGAFRGLMGNVNFEPTLKDVVIRNGVTYRISELQCLAPNGQKILYKIGFDL